MVTNLAHLRKYDPFFVGFDRLWKEIDRLDRTDAVTKQQSYPPYNIRKHEDDSFTIELAVAGFTEDEIRAAMGGNAIRVIADGISPIPMPEGLP